MILNASSMPGVGLSVIKLIVEYHLFIIPKMGSYHVETHSHSLCT